MSEWNTSPPEEEIMVILLIRTWHGLSMEIAKFDPKESSFTTYEWCNTFKHDDDRTLGWIPFPSPSLLKISKYLLDRENSHKHESYIKHEKWKNCERKLKNKNKMINGLREKLKETQK